MADAIIETVCAVAGRLSAVRGRYPGAEPDLVADVMRAVLGTPPSTPAGHDGALLDAVEELGRTIASAKAEIAALRVHDITASHIPSATDELDAIVAHTAGATHRILEACEALDGVGADLTGDAASRLQDATTEIYEACSFQDITGQRITKVVSTLQAIETKVAQMVLTFGAARHTGGEGAVQEGGAAEGGNAAEREGALLNGPQLPTAAMGQSDIDKLLASFD